MYTYLLGGRIEHQNTIYSGHSLTDDTLSSLRFLETFPGRLYNVIGIMKILVFDNCIKTF